MHPDGVLSIGQDWGIDWRQTDPPEKGTEAQDGFYVPNVPPKLEGEICRFYIILASLRFVAILPKSSIPCSNSFHRRPSIAN